MNRPDVVVAVDGSLYRFHPHFHDLMVEKLEQLVNPGIKVWKLLLSANGNNTVMFDFAVHVFIIIIIIIIIMFIIILL